MLTVNNVGLRYGDKKLFEDVSIKFSQVTVMVLLERMVLVNQRS